MMHFSTGIELERVGVVGLDQDYWWAELNDVGSLGQERDRCNVDLRAPMKCFSAKTKEGGRSARALPVAAPMPKLDSF